MHENRPAMAGPATGSITDQAKPGDSVALAVGSMNQGSNKAAVLIAMDESDITSPEARKGQQQILDLALGPAVSANDHRRLFTSLENSDLVQKGSNGRGYFLTELGKQVAARLRKGALL